MTCHSVFTQIDSNTIKTALQTNKVENSTVSNYELSESSKNAKIRSIDKSLPRISPGSHYDSPMHPQASVSDDVLHRQLTTTTLIEKVFGRINYERRSPIQLDNEFKLETIQTLLERLGNPHHDLAIIHIAGTKGKGSTAQFVSAIAHQLGFKTGVYSSPHFERYTERFQIDGAEVSLLQIESVLAKVLKQVEILDQEIESGTSLRPATFFDISTAAAFLLFKEHGVDLVALEVGLGGRLDSTNICVPIASIITSISFDHTKQLGETLVEIGTEKAGIIKPGRVAISGCTQPEIVELMRSIAEKNNAPFFQLAESFRVENVTTNHGQVTFDYCDHFLDSEANHSNQNANIEIRRITLNVRGEHQASNAALAIKSVFEFCKRQSSGIDFTDASSTEAIRNGLNTVSLKGRLEVISENPTVIVDMAHNEISISAMVDAINKNWPNEKRQAIFSCSTDKDHVAILNRLNGVFDQIVFTEFQANSRAQSGSTLITAYEKMVPQSRKTKLVLQETPELAWKFASRNFLNPESDSAENKFKLTCICGSIFLVGEMLKFVVDDLNERKRIERQ